MQIDTDQNSRFNPNADQFQSMPKALTGLDRESAHPLQLHVVKQSCCTAANLGATGWISS